MKNRVGGASDDVDGVAAPSMASGGALTGLGPRQVFLGAAPPWPCRQRIGVADARSKKKPATTSSDGTTLDGESRLRSRRLFKQQHPSSSPSRPRGIALRYPPSSITVDNASPSKARTRPRACCRSSFWQAFRANPVVNSMLDFVMEFSSAHAVLRDFGLLRPHFKDALLTFILFL